MEAEEREKQGRLGNTYHVNNIRWTRGREGGGGGGVPHYKYGHNSEFLTCQVEYLRSCECLGSCLVIERSMMKCSTLFHVFE